MIGQELRESIIEWAKQQSEPFITADVYQNIEEAESLKEASDSLRKLFLSGHLARKKIDNVRFIYVLSERASGDFEKCISDATDQDVISSKQTGSPAEVESVRNISGHAATEIKPGKISDGGNLKSGKSKTVAHNVPPLDAPEEIIPRFDLPESFTLKLQTPGGLMITITSGAINGAAQ